jgi:hypothetical protein
MTWSARRQLIIFSIVAIIILGGIGGFVFTRRDTATCFDGKQNQDERAVDCGGACFKLCKADAAQVVTEWQRVFKVSEGVYTAAAYLTNPNPQAEAMGVPYTFTLYDADNAVITKKEGKTYIPPGKSFAIVETNIELGRVIPVKVLFELGNTFDWNRIESRPPEVLIKNQRLSNASTQPEVTATIVNPTFNDIASIRVAVILFGTDGNAFAVSKTLVTNLKRESEQPLIFTWREPFNRPYSQILIIPVVQ